MRNFKKYDIWKLSHVFTLKIYELTNSFPKGEVYGIISQIRRASSSIPTNISEGSGRDSDAEFNRFFNNSFRFCLRSRISYNSFQRFRFYK
ncbi:four helix bundle protein [Wocania arenilitoris]|uniref:four helix bundle protein n=1 Tax=Wocania arenilitoris TaxID=2044858 RepID=UPI0034E23DB2